jgi:uncharacterized damage-inducible protein DinB
MKNVQGKKMNPEVMLLLKLIDEGYSKQAWHGPNLKGSIRGLSARQAAWRPSKKRHNIWEIVIHAAYWKYIVRRRLRGEKRGTFPIKGSNWFARPMIFTERAWRQDVALLENMHNQLHEALQEVKLRTLHARNPNSKYTNAQMIYGIAAHDIYHAGQIQLLKRLQP